MMLKKLRWLFLLLLMIGWIQFSHAQDIDTKPQMIKRAKLLASDGDTPDRFGFSVSLSGDYALIGAYGDADIVDAGGSAYIFKRNSDETWVEKVKLTPTSNPLLQRFAWSVSLDGDTAIMGTYGGGNYSAKKAFIFHRSTEDIWTEKSVLSDSVYKSYFGHSVSISGDYVIVGAAGTPDNGNQAGAAFIYKRNPDETWSQTAKILPSDGAAGDWFGYSVAINGDYVVIGAYGDDEQGAGTGSAYIFKRNGDETWTQTAKLFPPTANVDNNFGYAVAISVDRVLVGKYRGGAGYVFKRNADETWALESTLTYSGGPYIRSVSIDGDSAILAGSSPAYIYKRRGNTWGAPALAYGSGSYFGCSSSVSADRFIIGSYNEATKGIDAGAAFVYQAIPAPLSAPICSIESITQRPGTTVLDIDYAVSDDEDPTTKVGMLAFANGVQTWANLIQMKTLLEGTEANLGSGIANGTHRATWDAGVDWGVDLGDVKFTIFAQDSAPSIKQLHLIQVPAIDANPAFKINRVKWGSVDYLRAFLWLIATSDLSIIYEGGIARGVNGEYAGQQLYPITNQTLTHKFVGTLMGVRPATLDEITRAQRAFKDGIIQWDPRVPDADGKPTKVNELNIDTGNPAAADGWFVQD